MTLSTAPSFNPKNYNMAPTDLDLFQEMNNRLAQLADKPREIAQKFLNDIAEKMEKTKMSFTEIQEKLADNEYATAIMSFLHPSDAEISQHQEHSKLIDAQLTTLEDTKKKEMAASLKNIEEAGFLESTWERITEITGNVVDGALSLLKSIPTKYVVIAAALIVLLGSVSAALAFVKMGQAASASATFGALSELIGITPETFSAMTEPLADVLSGTHLGLPS